MGLSFAYLHAQRRFASVISTYLCHCLSNSTGPIPCAPKSNIAALKVAFDTEAYTAVVIETLDNKSSLFIVANRDAATSAKHHLKIGGKHYGWLGPYHLEVIK